MHLVGKKNIVIGVKMFGKQDILIVCALEQETQGQLDNYFDDERQILYTGVGKVNATLKLTQRLHSSHLHYMPKMPELVINYGTAGSRKYEQGELVDCTKFTQRDMDVTGMGYLKGQTPFENLTPMILDYDHVEFNPIGKKLRCGTGDNFVQTDKDTYSDVFDMEAYALAKVCHHYKVPFISFKYITDNADEHSSKDWVDNCSDGVREFKNKILEEL
jgi:adenosylhomocysteine nucleosidase